MVQSRRLPIWLWYTGDQCSVRRLYPAKSYITFSNIVIASCIRTFGLVISTILDPLMSNGKWCLAWFLSKLLGILRLVVYLPQLWNSSIKLMGPLPPLWLVRPLVWVCCRYLWACVHTSGMKDFCYFAPESSYSDFTRTPISASCSTSSKVKPFDPPLNMVEGWNRDWRMTWAPMPIS